jgi:hypothetical protein
VEIHRTARKHGVTDRQIFHALDSSPTSTTTPRPPGHWCSACDPSGNMLELVVLHFDDARDMVIHAMPMRRQYENLLPPEEPPT